MKVEKVIDLVQQQEVFRVTIGSEVFNFTQEGLNSLVKILEADLHAGNMALQMGSHNVDGYIVKWTPEGRRIGKALLKIDDVRRLRNEIKKII